MRDSTLSAWPCGVKNRTRSRLIVREEGRNGSWISSWLYGKTTCFHTSMPSLMVAPLPEMFFYSRQLLFILQDPAIGPPSVGCGCVGKPHMAKDCGKPVGAEGGRQQTGSKKVRPSVLQPAGIESCQQLHELGSEFFPIRGSGESTTQPMSWSQPVRDLR